MTQFLSPQHAFVVLKTTRWGGAEKLWGIAFPEPQKAAHVFPQIGGVLILGLTPTYPHFGLKVSANESKRVTSIAMLQMPKYTGKTFAKR